MRSPLTDAQVERAVREALGRMESGVSAPHAIVQELVGVDRYRLYRDCPDPERLAAFAEDSLPLSDALNVAAHEAGCPLCRVEIADLRGFLRQSAARLFAEMPAWHTPFQERVGLGDRLSAALEQGGQSCLTLRAQSGMGKTRLLLETAVEQSFQYPDGAWYVSCADSRTPEELLTAVAAASNLPRERRAHGSPAVAKALARRRALLVIDDICEAGVAESVVRSLTGEGAELSVLAGAGASVGVPGERTFTLPPLNADFEPGVDDPWSSDAYRFFASHVREFDSEYPLAGDRRADAVRRICSLSGGNPLAIELAAARSRMMTPEEIADRIQQAASPGGECGLDGLLAWTVGLLSLREQRFLRGLGVFAGSFAAEQAEVVCEEDDARELLAGLSHHALVQPLGDPARLRFRLLSPVHAYARKELRAASGAETRRHAVYYLGFAIKQAERLDRREQCDAVAAISADLPNLRAAAAWAEEAGERFIAGKFGLALQRFFFLQGDWQEGVDGLRRAASVFEGNGDIAQFHRARLSLAGSLANKGEFDEAESIYSAVADEAIRRSETLLLAEARHGMGSVAQRRRRYADASLWFEEALQGFDRAEDSRLAAICRLNLSWVRTRQGQLDEAQELLEECLPLLRERGDRYPLGDAFSNLGNIARIRGRWEEARLCFEESLKARREVGYAGGIAGMINNIGETWHATGDLARAEYCFADAARRYEELGNSRDLAAVRANQGALALDRSEKRLAAERFDDALRLMEETGDTHSAARVRRDLGRLAQSEGRLRDAAALFAESLSEFVRLGADPDIAPTLLYLGGLAESRGAHRRAGLMFAMARRVGGALSLPECAEAERALKALESRFSPEMVRQWTLEASTTSIDDIVTLLRDERV